MPIKKDNKCSICSLYYTVFLFDFTEDACIFCISNNLGKPKCFKCKKPFSRDNVAIREEIDGEQRIVHENGCK